MNSGKISETIKVLEELQEKYSNAHRQADTKDQQAFFAGAWWSVKEAIAELVKKAV